MQLPARIFDLHTHLFNARYLPLASIIANAMGRDESALATQVARLLNALTGAADLAGSAEVLPAQLLPNAADNDALCLEQIWHIAQKELLLSTGSLSAVEQGFAPQLEQSMDAPVFDRLRESELLEILQSLEQIDYEAEGLPADLVAGEQMQAAQELMTQGFFSGFLGWAKKVIHKALWAVTRLMDPQAWGELMSYPAFFLTLLHSEEQLLQKLLASYGPALPSLQCAHYLIDMQPAYAGETPYYPFAQQLGRMQALQRAHPARIFGFSAFDPRRDDWQQTALDALRKGFVGFKFYPAMGFKPAGNPPQIQERIDAFYDFCLARDLPIFAHCTPAGFQTRFQLGAYAHPRYWHEVLQQRPQLRLCLGHAGGGEMRNGALTSAGWMAETDAQWQHEDNFARIVVELCTHYPHVFCELGNLTQLLAPGGLELFAANMQRAKSRAAPYELLEKMAYGSDWHMPTMLSRTGSYLEIFLRWFESDAYVGYREAFFWQNAYRFLRLPR